MNIYLPTEKNEVATFLIKLRKFSNLGSNQFDIFGAKGHLFKYLSEPLAMVLKISRIDKEEVKMTLIQSTKNITRQNTHQTSSRRALCVCIAMAFLGVSCQKSNDSFSLLAEQSTFQQASTFQVRKIDILWVIDDSGSMATSQNNIITNFNSFIQRFQTLNYDFNMAFISTDAYMDLTDTQSGNPYRTTYCAGYNKKCSVFRDGPAKVSTPALHSGTPIITKLTAGISQVFNLNAAQGIQGYGDERPFLSIKVALDNPANTGFRRPDAFLAVIIVSDEDDYSQNAMTPALESLPGNGYLTDSHIHSVDSYVQYLSDYTQSNATIKNFSVSAITIMDQTCLDFLNTTFVRRLGTRLMQIADKTGGTKASLCGNFGQSLQLISDTVLTLSSSFKLDREPLKETIKVVVNGVSVFENEVNGWTYDATALTVNFHGTSIPSADASISITFDPVTVK